MSGLLTVGLTGQTGAGKSTVSRIFFESGIPVINCDQIARKVVEPGQECLSALAGCFGREILLPGGELNRRKLAGIVFSDEKKLRLLNGMIFPYITAEIKLWLAALAGQGVKLALLDAPTLFESGADALCELIVAVIAREELRLARIMERDSLLEQDARARMSCQKSEEFFRSHANFVIENNNGAEELSASTKDVIETILRKGQHNGS